MPIPVPLVAQNRRRSALYALGVGLVGLVALVIAVRAQRDVLIDDAAITMRYALRIATGHGFTYNDGDYTNGASAPLYTLVLAALSWSGWDLEVAATYLGVAAYVATCVLVTLIGLRASGVLGGVVGAALVLLSPTFVEQSSTGMEVALASALGVAVLWCLSRDLEIAAGVLLGLAVVNKLDASLLALGVLVAFLAVRRRIPWTLIGSAVATAAPWFVFAQLYFGAVLPFSASQKLEATGAQAIDHSWIVDSLRWNAMLLPAAVAIGAAVLAVVWASARELPAALVLVAATTWFSLHGLVFTFVDLGDHYSWYPTVLYPAIATAAAASVVIIRQAALTRPAAAIAATLVLVLCAWRHVPPAARATEAVLDGHIADHYELHDATRRAAGRFLGQEALTDEVISTCFGWVAYEAPYNPIRETCPLSTRRPVAPTTWLVEITYDDIEPGVTPAGSKLIVGFRSATSASWVYRMDDDQ